MISPLFLVWVLPAAILLGAAFGVLMTVIAILVYFSFVAVWLWHKAASAIRPSAFHWLTSNPVIRNPLRVKKTPTPSNPPGAQLNCS